MILIDGLCICCGDITTKYHSKYFVCKNKMCKKVFDALDDDIITYIEKYYDALDDGYDNIYLINNKVVEEVEIQIYQTFTKYRDHYYSFRSRSDRYNASDLNKDLGGYFYDSSLRYDDDDDDVYNESAKNFILNFENDFLSYIEKNYKLLNYKDTMYFRRQTTLYNEGDYYSVPICCLIYDKPDLSIIDQLYDQLRMVEKIKMKINQLSKSEYARQLGTAQGINMCNIVVFKNITLTKFNRI